MPTQLVQAVFYTMGIFAAIVLAAIGLASCRTMTVAETVSRYTPVVQFFVAMFLLPFVYDSILFVRRHAKR